MIIRELHCKDIKTHYNTVYELLMDVYEVNFSVTEEQSKAISLDKIEKLYGYINDGSAIVLGSFIDEKLIGLIWLYKHEVFNKPFIHVNQLVIKSQYRRHGIGKALMLEAEKQAKANNVEYIDLYVMEENKKAITLYDKLGFNTERRYMIKKI